MSVSYNRLWKQLIDKNMKRSFITIIMDRRMTIQKSLE